MSESPGNYRPDIDGLRAIAVASVVSFHAFPSSLGGGFVGVDIFFVISGFLITRILLKALDHGRFSVSEFYYRRITRIFPALCLVLAATLGIGWVSLLAHEYQQLGKHTAGAGVFASNLILWSESGYFDNAALTKPLLHLWSLGIEEQFYIFWPILLALAWKSKRGLGGLTAGLAVASFLLCVIQTKGNQTAAFYSPAARCWELMLGALLSQFAMRSAVPARAEMYEFPKLFGVRRSGGSQRQAIRQLARNGASFTGVLLIALAVLFVRESDFPGTAALWPVLGTVLVIAAGDTAWINRHILSAKPLVLLGLVSYPLYLWHWPLLSIVNIMQASPTPLMRAGLVAGALVCAVLTYLLVERPMRYGPKRHAYVGALVLSLAAVSFLGLWVFLNHGVASRAAVVENLSLDSGLDGGWPNNASPCDFLHTEERKLVNCAVDRRRVSPRFALVGDSKAGAIFPGLFRTAPEGSPWIYFGSGDAGPLLPVFSSDPLYAFYNRKAATIAMESVLREPSVSTVVIAAATRALFQLKNDYSIDDLPESAHLSVALDGLDRFVQRIVSGGRRVVLVEDNPTLPHMEDCLDRKTSLTWLDKLIAKPSSPACYLRLDRHLQLSEQYRRMLASIQERHPMQVQIFRTMPILCDVEKGVCPPSREGRLLYGATDHISDFASTLVGQALNRFVLSEGGPGSGAGALDKFP
ncbi:acyltransferase family protein [Methylolobus aquaticus]